MVYDPKAASERCRLDFKKQKESGKLPEFVVTKVAERKGRPYIICNVRIGDHDYQTSSYANGEDNQPEGLAVGDVINITNKGIVIVRKWEYTDECSGI